MSKYQEALDKVLDLINTENGGVKLYRENYIATLQELVDKETPKKLTEGFGLVCPNCKTQYVISSPKTFKYCPECGQRWSEDIETRNQ